VFSICGTKLFELIAVGMKGMLGQTRFPEPREVGARRRSWFRNLVKLVPDDVRGFGARKNYKRKTRCTVRPQVLLQIGNDERGVI
jgi:hypothetical protein